MFIRCLLLLQKHFRLLLTVVGVCWLGGYGFHLLANYMEIKADLRRSSALAIAPVVSNDSVSEIGYLYSMRRESNIVRAELNLVRVAVVPSTGERYSCVYQAGYPDFKVGDSVIVIHTKDGGDYEDYGGYIVGLHGTEKGKASYVLAANLRELEDIDTGEYD